MDKMNINDYVVEKMRDLLLVQSIFINVKPDERTFEEWEEVFKKILENT